MVDNTVATLTPTVIRAPGEVEFTVTGEKLKQLTAVTLNGQTATLLTPGKGGKSLKVKFATASTESLPASRTVPLTFFKGDDKANEKTIEVTRTSEGN